MMFQRVLLSLVVALPGSLLAFDAIAKDKAGTEVRYPVRLNPDAAPNQSAVAAEVSADKKCQFRTHDGCMLFTENTVGVIEFYLLGSNEHKMQCSDNGVRHVITKIELSTTALGKDYTKGKFGGAVLPWLKEFAFDDVNKSNGVVYEKTLQNGLTRVSLTNRNSHVPEGEAVKSFWYRVTATDCSDTTKTKVFDPRGDNEGLPQ